CPSTAAARVPGNRIIEIGALLSSARRPDGRELRTAPESGTSFAHLARVRQAIETRGLESTMNKLLTAALAATFLLGTPVMLRAEEPAKEAKKPAKKPADKKKAEGDEKK